jgi:Asp/Glu/hydantoin racemase
MRRIGLINPNTTQAITEAMAAAAREVAASGTELAARVGVLTTLARAVEQVCCELADHGLTARCRAVRACGVGVPDSGCADQLDATLWEGLIWCRLATSKSRAYATPVPVGYLTPVAGA